MTVDMVLDQLADLALSLVLATIVFILGYLLVRIVMMRIVRRLLQRIHVDKAFVNFASIIINILLMALVLIVALDTAGFKTGFLIAALAAVLIALIAGMQGWLQNVAAGLWMLLNDPFKLDDLVEISGKQGRVEEIQLLVTKLRTRDNLLIILPNRMIISNIITNFHAEPQRRIELVVEISRNDDIHTAIQVLKDVVLSDERVLREPEPVIAVADLGPNGTKLDVRPWVKQEDFTATRYALREKIKYALDANKITMPFPQLHIHNDQGPCLNTRKEPQAPGA